MFPAAWEGPPVVNSRLARGGLGAAPSSSAFRLRRRWNLARSSLRGSRETRRRAAGPAGPHPPSSFLYLARTGRTMRTEEGWTLGSPARATSSPGGTGGTGHRRCRPFSSLLGYSSCAPVVAVTGVAGVGNWEITTHIVPGSCLVTEGAARTRRPFICSGRHRPDSTRKVRKPADLWAWA